MARFVVEMIDGLDLEGTEWQLSRVRFGLLPPVGVAGPCWFMAMRRGVFEPEGGARDIRFGGVSLHRGE